MKNLTCIICPIGCSLDIDEGDAADANKLSVTGNRCPRGETYAQEEILAPKRVVTATVPVAPQLAAESQAGLIRRAPVKTSCACLRDKIPALLQDIYKTKVTLPVKAGDVVIKDWNGEGIDVVVTRTIDI